PGLRSRSRLGWWGWSCGTAFRGLRRQRRIPCPAVADARETSAAEKARRVGKLCAVALRDLATGPQVVRRDAPAVEELDVEAAPGHSGVTLVRRLAHVTDAVDAPVDDGVRLLGQHFAPVATGEAHAVRVHQLLDRTALHVRRGIANGAAVSAYKGGAHGVTSNPASPSNTTRPTRQAP
ncbi:MAG: hypothetical protein ACK5QX_04580, partial [bacterium]